MLKKLLFCASLFFCSHVIFADHIETIIAVRHAEKTPVEIGQLSCEGLNRALLLPHFFKTHFSKPHYIFAPNPAERITANGEHYSYLRPLMTIEPTAISLTMPVNTQIGFRQYQKLMQTLLEKKYHSATIYVAWEHFNLMHLASALFSQFHLNQQAPFWRENDYNMIYIFTIDWSKHPAVVNFKVASENMRHLNKMCPKGGNVPCRGRLTARATRSKNDL